MCVCICSWNRGATADVQFRPAAPRSQHTPPWPEQMHENVISMMISHDFGFTLNPMYINALSYI